MTGDSPDDQRVQAAVRRHVRNSAFAEADRPHGMATQVFRSADKAIETGRAAVDEGALADDGAVGAVVINAARQAVWA